MEECVAGLRACGIEGDDDELMRLALSFDADGNGTLDVLELQSAVEELMGARKASEQAYQEKKKRHASAMREAELQQHAADEFKVAKASKTPTKGSKAKTTAIRTAAEEQG